MIRVIIEVSDYGYEYRVVREQEVLIGTPSITDAADRLVQDARASFHGAMRTIPVPLGERPKELSP